jgi:hypothetical protein
MGVNEARLGAWRMARWRKPASGGYRVPVDVLDADVVVP